MAVPVGKTVISNILRPIAFRTFSSTPAQTTENIKFENPIIAQNEQKPPTNTANPSDPALTLNPYPLEPQALQGPLDPQPSPPEAHLFGLGLPLDKTASTSTAYTDIERSIRWGHDGRTSIVGYDIFQELEERLQEVLSRNDAGPAATIKIQDSKTGDKSESGSPENGKDIKKVNKVSAALESLNRFLSFYLFRSTLYPKRW